MSEQTVFEAAGGADAFLRLTWRFYSRVAADPVLAPVFKDMAGDHVEGVALWIGEVSADPNAIRRSGAVIPT